ncbi:MAG TPA: TIM-barrel domain-containing protein [Casimicrobiaceae bacterium]|nr:TIM-barrel domain-containing protein [Casimicrobiaceae bacterium]
MHLDPSDYLRLDIPQSLGASSSGASFATSSGDVLEVECFGPGAFRLRAGPNARPDYGIVVGRPRPCEVAQSQPGTWALTSGDSTLEITGAPLSMRLLWKGELVLTTVTDEHARGGTRLPTLGRLRQGGLWTAAFALASGESIYGLGEKFGSLDKRGQLVHSQVADAQGVNTGLAYKNTPFAWSPGNGTGAWGMFVNTPGMVTHGVGHPDWSHRSYAIMVEDEALDLFLFAGDAPARILDLYTALTGRPAGVPRWSLGLWVSRAGFESPEDAIAVAARMRERRLPCDVLALDAGSVWNPETLFDFAWDPDRIPDPTATLARIKEQNLRVCVWECPYVGVESPLFQDLASQQYLLTTQQGDPYVFVPEATRGAGAAEGALESPLECGIVDFTNADAYAWWRDAHQVLFEDGVDAFEGGLGEHVPDDAIASNGDFGARLHNVYPLLYSRCLHEATAHFQAPGAGPPVVWSRSGWAGSQRYPLGYGGDQQSDWEALAASIRGGLSWGMSGNPYHGLDIGGVYGSVEPSADLYLRWLQAAVFGSHLRLRGAGEREPWTWGADAEAVARKWLALRYRLIPYLESVIAQAMRTGLPVTRGMPLAFPESRLVRAYETQFMCGDALLVAPIVREGGSVEIALPPGAWYDLNTRARYPGSRVLRYRARLDQFPVFGREGHALPLGRAVQHTGEIDVEQPLEWLWVFGTPAQSLDGYAQARIEREHAGGFVVRAAPGVDVQVFGDPAAVSIQPL